MTGKRPLVVLTDEGGKAILPYQGMQRTEIIFTKSFGEIHSDSCSLLLSVLRRPWNVRNPQVAVGIQEKRLTQTVRFILRASDDGEAESTGGRFFDAQDPEALRAAVEQALAVPYDVVDASGTRVTSGWVGAPEVELPEGVYTVEVQVADGALVVPDVAVRSSTTTQVELEKEGDRVGTSVLTEG